MWNRDTPVRLYPARDEPSLINWEIVALILLMVLVSIILFVLVFHFGGTESGMYYNRFEYLI